MRLLGGFLWLAASAAWAQDDSEERLVSRDPAAVEKEDVSKGPEIRVLARVAGSVVTDRRVMLDHTIEHPDEYRPGLRMKLPRETFDKAFQRVLTQIMVSEDNKIVGLTQVSEKDVDESLAGLRRALGSNYKRFLADFDVGESEIRPLLAEKSLLRKSLGAKVRAASEAVVASDDSAKAEPAQRAVDEWLRQLRTRYRVQLFKGLSP